MQRFKKHVHSLFKRYQKGYTGILYLVVILVLLIMGGILLTGGLEPSPKEAGTGTQVMISPYQPSPDKENLQLYTFWGGTIAPTIPAEPTAPNAPPPRRPPTGGVCKHDSIAVNCTCPTDEMEWLFCQDDPCDGLSTATLGPLGGIVSNLVPAHLCVFPQFHPKFSQRYSDGRCTHMCLGKPVIYLYPTQDTIVDVSIDVPGKIIASDPLYPTDGWKQVLAHPSGKLEYQDKSYRELFFESEVDHVNQPTNGIVIPVGNLTNELDKQITKLGLIGDEKTEFIDFWVPKLQALHTPYILFSVLDRVEKERVDHINITPKPNTFISFITYFKPLTIPYTGLPTLTLPKTPQRIGFTAVEWGGTIDTGDANSSTMIIGR